MEEARKFSKCSIVIIAGILLVLTLNMSVHLSLADQAATYIMMTLAAVFASSASVKLFINGFESEISYKLLWFLFLKCIYLVSFSVVMLTRAIELIVPRVAVDAEVFRGIFLYVIFVALIGTSVINTKLEADQSFISVVTHLVMYITLAGFVYYGLRVLLRFVM